ncbi:hypothetical protein [Paraburkholderia saeva]|uniref:Uncharacterized protein n=1 Tax=Paraburkholderia saeva TaxID=2777537 RepID=A0A9N8X503_9BURK|nr:hypothetical protein [Paraburkholderia saeva]CAG4917516.1 hypothetical protein LMG31841_04690 [Paraburkholderia saeva]
MNPTLRKVLVAMSLVALAAGPAGCKRADTSSDSGATGMSNSASTPAAAGAMAASGASQ